MIEIPRLSEKRLERRKAFEAEVVSKGLAERSLSAESVRDLFVVVCGHIAGLHQHCKPPQRQALRSTRWQRAGVAARSAALRLRTSNRPFQS